MSYTLVNASGQYFSATSFGLTPVSDTAYTGDITLAAWVLTDGDVPVVVGAAGLGYATDTTTDILALGVSQSDLAQAVARSSSTETVTVATPAVAAEWTLLIMTARYSAGHLVQVFSAPAGGSLTGSAEGVSAKSMSVTSPDSWPALLQVGRGINTSYGAPFDGKIAEVSIWNKVLDSTERAGLISKTANKMALDQSITGNLKAYWKLYDGLTSDTTYGGDYTLTATGGPSADTGSHPSLTDIGPSGVTKLKLMAHSSAASATNVSGVVFEAPTGGAITGAKIGEFTGKSFEASLESGQAVLKVATSEFDTGSPQAGLTTSDTPVALVRNASNTTGLVSCTVIEE